MWSTLFPLGARSGEPTICCMNVDITEREMSKAQLEIESHLLAQSERLSAVGSWQWHVQSDTVRWSEELCRIFGVAYDSRASQTFAGYLAALHPDDRGLVRTEVERTLETGEGYEMENRAVRPDGSIRTLLCRGDARVENGKVVALFGIAQDITERREREQKERELEQHIRLVTEQLPAAVWSTDADLNLTFARGRALAALTGLDPASLRQQPLRELFGSGPHAGLALEAHTRALAGEARAFEIGVGGKWLEAHVEPLRDPHEGTVIGTTAAALDVTDRKRAEEELAYRAYNDALTALPNRNLLDDRLSLALPQAQRHRKMLAVLYVDIDHFKIINDTLGHATGDKLLTDLAARLKKITRAGDTIARVGGDEFVVLLPEVGSSAEAQRVAEKILETTSKPFELGGKDFYVTASIGIALSPADGETAEELIKNADSAMYRAKETGRAGYQLCTRELTARAFRRLELETSLHRAIEQDELRLHYQPILDIGNGSLLAFEALLRWQREEELLFPDAFLPIAEESHLIVRIGQWVLERACADAARWLGDGGSHVSANVSARHFQQAGFASAVAGALAATGLSPARLELEITESAAMQNLETTTTTLQELRSLGVGIVIDDFGTGHSSLNYLKRFPLTGLKIDRSFVADMMDNRSDEAIVQAIIGTGRA
ncbi:MAG TPA: EAL domain-containing protein, partial [Thermoanaerobaculia bacterium]